MTSHRSSASRSVTAATDATLPFQDVSAEIDHVASQRHTRLACDRNQLGRDLRRLGVSKGNTVLVHSSLRRLGFVAGGARTVVQALLDVLGPDGTLVVPTFTANNSDPSRWAQTCNRPVPRDRWPAIRDQMPAFDPVLTPSCNAGVIAETVRTWPGAVRSDHPQTSFAALGAAARQLMACHASDCHLGPESPLGALDQSGAKVLLLGVSFAACTAFHLAEYQIPQRSFREYECVIRVDGDRQWYRYQDVVLDDADFERLGAAFEASDAGSGVRRGTVGGGESRLFRISDAVAFAKAWMTANRSA